MRIYALITDAYGGHGGISVYNRDMLEAFTRHPSVQEVIAAPRVISHPLENMPARLLYRVVAAGGIGMFLRCILRDLPNIAKSDLIYCGHLNLAPLAWVLGRVFRKPVLGALYGIEAWEPDQKILRRMAAKHLAHYYAISAFTRDRFCAWSGVVKDHVTLLPNAIHLKDYGLAEKSPDLGARYGLEGKKVLMTFGRLVSRTRAKGFDEVLDVLPELLQETPEIAYVIAGDGPDRDRLAARVQDLGLQDCVVFTGFVDEAEKAALYSLADLYIMPSRGEGFGFVFLEAMACGVPVIASSVDGSRDAVRDGALGPVVDPDDRKALVQAIRDGLRAPRAIPKGLEFFDFPNFVSRTHAILDRMTDR